MAVLESHDRMLLVPWRFPKAAIKDDRKTFLNSQGREPVLVLVDREVYGLPRSGDAAISDDCM